MPTIKELLDSARAIDDRLALAKQVTLVPGTTNQVQPVAGPKYAIYKLTNGERSERASKVGQTQNEAHLWIEARPDQTYEIVPE